MTEEGGGCAAHKLVLRDTCICRTKRSGKFSIRPFSFWDELSLWPHQEGMWGSHTAAGCPCEATSAITHNLVGSQQGLYEALQGSG